MHIYDMIIVGGGPAGYTAALYGARSGLDVLVLEKMGAGGQMALTSQIDNYPGYADGVDGFTLGADMRRGAEKFGAKTRFAQVTALSLQENPKEVHLQEETLYAKTVILATGASARKLGVAGEDALIGAGISYCAHCDGMLYRGRTVAVVGGGNTAAAAALTLSRYCKKVYLIHRRDSLRASKVYHSQLENTENIEFYWNSKVTALHADGVLQAVTLEQNGRQVLLDVDGLFVSIGQTPNTELVKGQLALDENGYILAGETTETSIPGVFAPGDVRTTPLRQIITAAADGAVAAHRAEEYLNHL